MSAGRCKMDTILNGVFGTFDGATEDGYKQINNMLDDGDSWDECSFINPSLLIFAFVMPCMLCIRIKTIACPTFFAWMISW